MYVVHGFFLCVASFHPLTFSLQYVAKYCKRESILEGPFQIRHSPQPLCLESFPSGERQSMPRWPRVAGVNKLGGYDLAMDREPLNERPKFQ